MTDRKIIQVHINPMNGAIVALADDGSLWQRPGEHAATKKSWNPIPPLPSTNPPKEESEDALTTIVK